MGKKTSTYHSLTCSQTFTSHNEFAGKPCAADITWHSLSIFIPHGSPQLLLKTAGVLHLCMCEDTADGWTCWARPHRVYLPPSALLMDYQVFSWSLTESRNPAKRLWLDYNRRQAGRSWFWFNAWTFSSAYLIFLSSQRHAAHGWTLN